MLPGAGRHLMFIHAPPELQKLSLHCFDVVRHFGLGGPCRYSFSFVQVPLGISFKVLFWHVCPPFRGHVLSQALEVAQTCGQIATSNSV
jgi:hypothetical protein